MGPLPGHGPHNRKELKRVSSQGLIRKLQVTHIRNQDQALRLQLSFLCMAFALPGVWHRLTTTHYTNMQLKLNDLRTP